MYAPNSTMGRAGVIGGGLEEEEKKVVSGWLGFRLKTFKVANAATYKNFTS